MGLKVWLLAHLTDEPTIQFYPLKPHNNTAILPEFPPVSSVLVPMCPLWVMWIVWVFYFYHGCLIDGESLADCMVPSCSDLSIERFFSCLTCSHLRVHIRYTDSISRIWISQVVPWWANGELVICRTMPTCSGLSIRAVVLLFPQWFPYFLH
jgi:hypothetical protein